MHESRTLATMVAAVVSAKNLVVGEWPAGAAQMEGGMAENWVSRWVDGSMT